ncbi:carotenoid oxygenase [Pisolithus tinctorius]|nr:carotenoid oxygenase [Pisolithus tinctorius]
MTLDATSSIEHFNNWPNDTGFEILHEEREPVELTVSGCIPSYVSGTLYRTGPGGRQNHRFQIIQTGSSARVMYNSRRSIDPLIENIRRTGNMAGFSFGQKRDPCTSFFKKVMSVFVPDPPRPQEQVNICVTLSINPPGLSSPQTAENQKIHGRHASGIHTLLVKTDAFIMRHIDPETLEPRGVVSQKTLHPKLTGILSAAHAKSDPVTGDVYNYNLALGRNPTYRVFRVSAATGQTEILATITDAPGAYFHSSLITESHFILCVWSGRYAGGGLKILWEKNFLDAISPFDPNQKALWYVIDRKQGKGVEPSPTDPLHTDIVADLSIYKNLDVLKRFYYNNIKSSSPASLDYAGDRRRSCDVFFRRWRLPSVNAANPRKPQEAVVVHTAAYNHSCEFPVINPCFLTKQSRYVYGACDRSLSTFFDGLVKYDVHTQTATYFSVHGHSPGEAIFIPNPVGTTEDDGVLLSVVLDGYADKSYLLVLDAKTMKEVGRASMDFAVSFGFHGAYRSQAVEGPNTDI